MNKNIFQILYNQIEKFEGVLKIGTFFSGIGSPEQAVKRLKANNLINGYETMFYCEIDRAASKTYSVINSVDENKNLGSITNVKGANLPYCDLWIGGFPCQDISLSGKMRGFTFQSSTRSSLGWEMIRLLSEVERKPKFVIFENVANIASSMFVQTLQLFKYDLEKLGYTLYDDVLNAQNYGIPQKRQRYFLVALLGEYGYCFPQKLSIKSVVKDILENADEKYFLTTNKYDINNRGLRVYHKKNNDKVKYHLDINRFLYCDVCGKDVNSKFNQTSRITSELGIAPTLTASNTADNCKIATTCNKTLEDIRLRLITPRESWRLMGFSDDVYELAKECTTDTNLYHQAGNSIVVDVIYAILRTLLE